MKIFVLILAAVIVVLCAAACNISKTEIGSSLPQLGGYTDSVSPEVTAEMKTLLKKAGGGKYTAVACLADQLVSGENHLLLCKVKNGDSDFYALVTLYEPLDGKAEITNAVISSVSAPAPYDAKNPISGGWGEPTSPVMTEEALSAVEKACETLTGAVYEPKALLASQVVAGMNYSVLCKAAPSVPDGESYYVIIKVYADLDGNAEITDTYEFK